MSALIGGVLKLTFGFLVKKARVKIADHLKDGDAAHIHFRDLILRELDDIKSKLKGLARKDLLSSICFLEEGTNGLFQALLRFKTNELTDASTDQEASQRSQPETSDLNSSFDQVTAFINAVASCKSSPNFASAMESFKLAREKATEAFCNEALSIEDRIQASQVRMAARILEKLEDPDAGVSDCLQYLKQLHGTGAIQKTFSVLIDGGLIERLRKTTRLNNARSIHLMNKLLFRFAREYARSRPRCLADWPVVLFSEKIYHPLFGTDCVVEKLEESGVKVMSPYPDVEFDDKIFPPRSVVNSKGEIIAEMTKESVIKIFQPSPSRDSCTNRVFCEIPKDEDASLCRIVAMDIDAEDNLYVIAGFKAKNEHWSHKLFVFDEEGHSKLKRFLPILLKQSSWLKVRMAVKKDGEIAILNCDENVLHTGSNPIKAELKLKSFRLTGVQATNGNELSVAGRGNIRFSDLDGTKIISAAGTAINIFTVEGVLQRKIKIPKGLGSITSVAIIHSKNRILIKTVILKGRFNLPSFSETGELIDSLCLGSSKWVEYAKVISHPNGAVALVGETGAAFVELL